MFYSLPTSDLTIFIIIIIIILITLFYLYMTRNFNYWKKRGVPFEPPVGIFGNLGGLFFSTIAAGPLLKRIYDYSHSDAPYVGFFTFDKPMLLLRDPDIIKNILVRDFHLFSNRFANTVPHEKIASSGLFMINNPGWKYLRSKLSPLYTSVRLKKMYERMLDVATDLDTHMNSLNLIDDGKDIEMKEICAQFTTDMIATTAYGLRVNSLNNPNAEFRKYGQEIFKASILRNWEICAFFFAPQLAEFLGLKWFSKAATNLLREAFWSTIREREQSKIKQIDLIDILIELKNDNNPVDKNVFAFEGDNIVAQPAIFFTAGFETSSTLFSFTLYELAINPEIQNRLRREILNALKQSNGIITYELVTKLPYLDMVTSETLRKYPPLPFLDRVASVDYKIPNSELVIEKGTPVFISLTGLHNDTRFYQNPKEYDPDRFSEERKDSIKSVYLPFGDGPRNCIGSRLGLIQSKLGLIKMLSKYEFSPCKKTLIPMELSAKGLMTTPKAGIHLNVKKI